MGGSQKNRAHSVEMVNELNNLHRGTRCAETCGKSD
jgi:hypothetical protein